MPPGDYDPAFYRARREAVWILIFFAAALAYTVGYCALFGYGRSVVTIRTYWGVPDWVCWGIVVPWGVCSVLTAWFSLCHMADDDPPQPPDSRTDAASSRFPERDVADGS